MRWKSRWVTPSRVCELKCDYSREQIYTTGSHPHGCVSWNIKENNLTVLTVAVTPSRVCELKSEWENTARSISQVTPSRVCELKLEINKSIKSPLSHTLTGVWVEISYSNNRCFRWNVTPSRVCELKFGLGRRYKDINGVTPSRVCELK